jgi:PAS domain S-box-containing protein
MSGVEAESLRARLTELTAEARSLADGKSNTIALLRALIEPLPFAALVADNEGCYVLANAMAVRLTGYTREELRHLCVRDLSPGVNEHETERLWLIFRERSEQYGDYRLVVKDGRKVTTQYAAQANVLPGLHISLLYVSDDEPPNGDRE